MSDFSQSNSAAFNKAPKTKAEYSRNIKKLKLKLAKVQQEIEDVEKKMKAFSNTSNDKMIALKISKFCKQRKMTPQMVYRCADRARKNTVSKAAFKDTLAALGIKLTQHEMTRLEYLLDEDVSGQISQQEYNAYLMAFKIKSEFSTQDVLLQDILKKLDITNLVTDESKDNNKKKRQLLNYQQFLKFCHRHMSNLKDKEIAAIFNLLQKNNLIDVDQFLSYIKKKQEERRKLELKNKNNKHTNKDSLADGTTLKGIIKAILKNRPKDSKPLFHSLEFVKIEKILNKDKGELLGLFKNIDKQKRGSFGFNELIQFYVVQEKTGDLLFAYELMGRKMYIDKEKPEDVIQRYNGGATHKKITNSDFKKFMLKEFGLLETDAEAVYRALEKKENEVYVKAIVDAMKLEEGQKKIIYIKPTMWKTFGLDFWKKNSMTILFNPFVALRFCMCISEELKKAQQRYWDDFEFGPTFEDPYGLQSTGLDNTSSDAIKWLTVESLGMKDFYADLNGEQYLSSNNCIHDMFPMAFTQLVKSGELSLWSSEKGNYNVKKVEEEHLKHLFEGVYPLIFHPFASCGIYVFRFYSREKWAYVLVDNKIPCSSDNEPLFSRSKSQTHSWVSLIEKGYAKLKGSYKALFQVKSVSHYTHQITRKLPLILNLPKNLSSPDQKNIYWAKILNQKRVEEQKMFAFSTDSTTLTQSKSQTGFKVNNFNQIMSVIEIKDQKTANPHKSHRLAIVKADVKNEKVWNPNWNSSEQNNKFNKFYSQIEDELKKKGKKENILKFKNVSVLNYKLFRSIFDSVISIRNFAYEKMAILRKIVEFEEKHACRYQLNSKLPNKQPFKLITSLNKIRGPQDSTIELVVKDKKNGEMGKKTQTGNFEAFQFQISSDMQYLQIKVLNWREKLDYVYVLTFYIETTLYHLKELDRQELFEFLSPSAEEHGLDMGEADEKERVYIYRNYFKGAQRGGGCCG